MSPSFFAKAVLSGYQGLAGYVVSVWAGNRRHEHTPDLKSRPSSSSMFMFRSDVDAGGLEVGCGK